MEIDPKQLSEKTVKRDPSKTEQIKCVHCSGAGEAGVLVYGAFNGGCEWRFLKCQACDGTGLMSLAQGVAYTKARRWRGIRLAAGISQRQMAEHFGVDISMFIHMELGLQPFAEGSVYMFTKLEQGLSPKEVFG